MSFEDSYEIVKLLKNMDIINKMFDEARIVSPVEKKVLKLKNDEIVESDMDCFSFWKSNKICKNCISMRALIRNETLVKLEQNENQVYMITAIPIEINGNKIVLELLKNATNSIIMKDDEKNLEANLQDIILSINDLAVLDALTGIYNRRYIDEKLPNDIINSYITKKPISIIIADIDFFKSINDKYGHICGDYILKNYAMMLQENIRNDIDWVSRYGGDEFLICLIDTENHKAKEIAERLRLKIEKLQLKYNNQLIKITASFGVYTLNNCENICFEEFIRLADENLYKAKKAGRNKVV